MPRRTIQYAPGHFYHLYNRGARRLSIFREPDNYLFVLKQIGRYTGELGLAVIAYCLLPNHYHLLVRQDGEQSAGLLPTRVFNSYSKAYNKRYGHAGTLFADRYRAVHVERDGQLLHLCRYIHANPVKHGIRRGQDWPYSNFAEWAGTRQGTLVDREFVCGNFASGDEYRAFVMDYVRDRWLPPELAYLEG